MSVLFPALGTPKTATFKRCRGTEEGVGDSFNASQCVTGVKWTLLWLDEEEGGGGKGSSEEEEEEEAFFFSSATLLSSFPFGKTRNSCFFGLRHKTKVVEKGAAVSVVYIVVVFVVLPPPPPPLVAENGKTTRREQTPTQCRNIAGNHAG